MYEEKVKMIEGYIDKADAIISEGNRTKANALCDQIIAAFGNEIDDITNQLYLIDPPNSINDLTLLKAKLENYKVNITSGFYKIVSQKGGDTYLSQNTNVAQNTVFNITFESVISQISNLPDNILSQNEKESLQGKIAVIEASKNAGKPKAEIWSKIKPVLAFLADKGADATIAALPYIVATLQAVP